MAPATSAKIAAARPAAAEGYETCEGVNLTMKSKNRTISSAGRRAEQQISNAWTRKEIDALEKRWLNACMKELKRLFERKPTNREQISHRVAFLRVLCRHIKEEVTNARKQQEIWDSA